MVGKVTEKFEETGNVKNNTKSSRAKFASAGQNGLNILLSIKENPKQSTRSFAENFDVCAKSVSSILKKGKKKYQYIFFYSRCVRR